MNACVHNIITHKKKKEKRWIGTHSLFVSVSFCLFLLNNVYKHTQTHKIHTCTHAHTNTLTQTLIETHTQTRMNIHFQLFCRHQINVLLWMQYSRCGSLFQTKQKPKKTPPPLRLHAFSSACTRALFITHLLSLSHSVFLALSFSLLPDQSFFSLCMSMSGE